MRYYTQLTIDSETLYRYFHQIKSMEDYVKTLPEDAKAGFSPFTSTMRDGLLANARTATGIQTGLKTAFTPIETDEIPF